MNKLLWFLVFGLVFTGFSSYGQITVSTTHTNNNSSQGVTFNFYNGNASAILLQQVQAQCTGTGTQTFELWMHPDPINGAPGNISTSTGWTMIGSTTTSVTSNTTLPLVTGMNQLIAAGDTVGMYFRSSTSNVGYFTLPSATINIFTNGGASIITGGPMGWGGNITGPTNNPRGFVGGITFIPAAPCTGTPLAGTVLASDTNACSNDPVMLSTVGSTLASGITYHWYAGSSASGPFSLLDSGTSITAFPTATTYYYAQVSCGANSSYTDTVMVTVPAAFPAGTYTIDQTSAASATNFATIASAIDAISCGTTGPVIFNVVAGTGPYNEQMVIPQVNTNSAASTITFNGNGETLSPPSLTSTAPGAVTISGDYFIIDSFNIAPLGSTVWGVHLKDDADNNIIRNNTISVTTSITSSSYNGIIASAGTSVSSTSTCDSNLIENNIITGGYYGIRINGSSSIPVWGNNIIGNTLNDFYSYGLYNYGNRNALINDNTMGRPTRTSVSSAYPLYTSYSGGCTVDGNHIEDCFAAAASSTSLFYAIYAYQYADSITSTYSNNIVDLQSGGGTHYGLYVYGEAIKMLHNTVNVGSTTSTNSGSKYGIYYSGISTILPVISNNIIYSSIPNSATAVNYGIFHSSSGSYMDGGNNWFFLDPANTSNKYRFNGTDYNTLADYQTASGGQAASIETNPMYVSAPTDYTPANYAFDNYGIPLGVLVDYNDVVRGAVPDVGAIEFSAPPCTAPPTAGTTIVSDTVICAGFNVNFSLAGNSYGSGQTYTWQWSSSASGTYTDLGPGSISPVGQYPADSTGYYHCMVICGTDTAYSTPVFIQTNPALAAGTYTIDQTSTTADFASFNEAAAALECGITGPVVFDVVAGTGPYLEQVHLPQVVGASATNTITFNGNGEILRFDTPSTGDRAVLTLNGTDYTTIDSLNIHTFGGTYGAGVILTNNADYNTISSCTIMVDSTSTSSNYFGMALTATTSSPTTTGTTGMYNTFKDNTIVGGYYGMVINGASIATPASGNKFLNNIVREFYYYAVRTYYTDNTEVVGNDVLSPNRNNGSYKYGIYSYYGLGGMKIANNAVHNIYDNNTAATGYLYGIYLGYCDAPASNPNKAYNNEVYYIIHNGGAYGIYNYSSDNTTIYHNSILFDNQLSTASSGAVNGIYLSGGPFMGVEVKNNLISLSETGTHNKIGLYYFYVPNASDYNDVYIPATSTNAFYGYAGSNLATLAAFQTASLTDTNSIDADPMTAPLTTDPTPLNTLMNNLGTPVGVTTDFIGNFRSTSTPDIGSREFPVCYPSVTTITSSSPNNMACIGDTLTLSAPAGATAYQWQLNGNDIPGATAVDYTATGSGNYTVIIDSAGCIGSQVTPTTVTINPLPMVDAGADAAYCDLSSVTLYGMGADTYTWDNGVVDGVAFNIATSGAYTVTGTDSTTGCMNTDTVMLTVLPLPQADAGPDQLVCDGATVTLTGSGGDSLYWDNGVVDGVAFTPSATGSYILTTMNDSTGCMAMDTVMVTVGTSPTLTIINQTNTGGLSFNFTSDASGATTYAWDFGDGNTDNSASPNHTYTTTGMTTVTLTVTNDCGSTTKTIEVPVGIRNIEAAGIRVYPNPTKGQVTIESATNYSLTSIRLLNVLGAEVEVGTNLNSSRAELNMSALSAGMYTLLINTDKGTYQQVINLVD